MKADENKVVAITGANGSLGRMLCSYFLEKGFRVIALARSQTNIPEPCDFIHYRLGDGLPDTLPRLKTLIHCAWAMAPENRDLNLQAVEVLKCHLTGQNTPMVFISSISAGTEGKSVYARSKMEAERLLDSGFDLIVRPGLILAASGLFSRIQSVVEKYPVIPLPATRNEIRIIASEDVCLMIHEAAVQGLSGKFNVALGSGIRLRDMIKIIAQSLGRRNLILEMPVWVFRLLLNLSAVLKLNRGLQQENLNGLLVSTSRESKETLEYFNIADISPQELIQKYISAQ